MLRDWHLSLLFVLLLNPATVFAVPPAPPGRLSSNNPQAASWRHTTNKIVATLWGEKKPIESEKKDIGRLKKPVSARYGRDIVLRFNVTTAADAKAIAEAAEDLYLDVWEFNDDWVDIRLAKDIVPSLLGLLPPSLQHAHAPLMPESGLAEIISQSRPSTHQTPFSLNLNHHSKDLFFSEYQPMSVIAPWMNLMASMFPTHTRLINIGMSWEGRDIPALRVGVHPTNDDKPSEKRRTIIISGGVHAREWISTSTVLYVANNIITSYGKDTHWTAMVDRFDWIFIPTLNPDGYVYTWETDRLWRKNRQPTPLRFCHGIDLDRAFGFEWDGDASGGNPCSESYAGAEAWQAVEAQHFAEWARNETENSNTEIVALLDLHSYSQQVLYPYSYSCAASPPTLEDLEELGLGLAKAMRLTNHGHYYKATSACEGNVALSKLDGSRTKERFQRIELGGGSLLDWFYHDLRIKYAYQIKLRDTGSYGFLLPKENIVPQGREMFNAVAYLGRYLLGQVGLAADDATAGEEVEEMVTAEKHQANVDPEEEKEQETRPVREGVEEHGSDHEISIQWELKRRRRR